MLLNCLPHPLVIMIETYEASKDKYFSTTDVYTSLQSSGD